MKMIGVFDSGVGGLTVLKDLLKELPDHNYIYLGDNARVPYGDKSQETIYGYTKEAMDFLFAKGCKLIIIACNTASSKALRRIQQEYLPERYPGKKVLGVVRPLAEKVASGYHKKVGVIGTRATIDSGVYPIEINKIDPDIKVKQLATPLLAPLIENGWTGNPETKAIVKRYLEAFKDENIQSLIPACTHYEFLIDIIREIMGDCEVCDPGNIIALSLKSYLERHPELDIEKVRDPDTVFYTTDSGKIFKDLGEKFLNREIKNISEIKLQF